MADVDIRVSHHVVTTAGSTQTITHSSAGTPVGALFFWSRATADSGPPLLHAHIGMGATDFTREWACSYYSEDAADPSNATHMGSNDKCIQFSNASGTGVETNMEADAAVVTDGLELTWTGTPGVARRFMVVLFYGDNCHCEAGTVLSNADAVDTAVNITLTAMTVRPEMVFVGFPRANAFSSTISAQGACGFGFGADHSGTIDQANKSWIDVDGRNPANRHGENVESTHIASASPVSGNVLFSAWELTQTGVNGTPRGTFQMTKRITGNTSSFGYFCYSSDGNNSYDVSLPVLLHSAGTKSYTDAGFEPQAALLLPSSVEAVGVSVAATAAGVGVSAIDATTLDEGCYHTQSEESDPSDASSTFAGQFINISFATGALDYTDDFSAFTATGFDYVPNNTTSAAKPTPVCCIGIDTVAATRRRAMVVS